MRALPTARYPGGEPGHAGGRTECFSLPQKELAPKYFYDARGSRLFEEITTLDEYYPTRTERGMLLALMPGLVGELKSALFVELGAEAPKRVALFSMRCRTPAPWKPTYRSMSARISWPRLPAGSELNTPASDQPGRRGHFKINFPVFPARRSSPWQTDLQLRGWAGHRAAPADCRRDAARGPVPDGWTGGRIWRRPGVGL